MNTVQENQSVEKMEHTPGPWKTEQVTPHQIAVVAPWSETIRPTNAWGFGDSRGIWIAKIDHHIGEGMAPKEHAEANARVIAAAPKMLADHAFFLSRQGRDEADVIATLVDRYGVTEESARAAWIEGRTH